MRQTKHRVRVTEEGEYDGDVGEFDDDVQFA